ncbi:hypothetical protein HK098_003323 [Nowakowskiella sp. JEL0407]|nr:hypothetical protein HK098_003323 [Nowakowskiella sp. JEL0407]
MHTIPTDSDGIKTSALRTHLERLSTSPEFQQKLKSMELDSTVSSGDWKRFPFLLYLVPTFSNPTGSTLSHSRRAEIISLAREYNILIVCDDVYQMLDYSSELSHLSLTHFSTPPSLDPPPQRLISYDLETLQPNEFGNVISNCTFSKLFAPGVRLGWIESSPKIIDQYNRSGILYSGGSPNHAMSGIFTSLLKTEYGESGVSLLQMHINKLKKTYAENLVAVCTALEKNLPPNIAKFRIPTGGFFIWIEFDKDKLPDTLELLRAIKPAVDTVSVVDRVEISDGKSKSGVYRGKQIQTQKVSYSPGNIFSPDRTAGNCLRLAFTFYEKEKLVLGVERLCAALKEIL